MSYQTQQTEHLQNMLAAYTDAMLANHDDAEAIVGFYKIPREEVEGILGLIRRLQGTFIYVHPSKRYVRRLRNDLVGEPQPNVINTIRYLPPRVQIAAGVALLAGGVMLLSRRRLLALPDAKAAVEAITATN
jgi:hypothetical protein